jgi:excisionase family DNA binding protein
VDQEPVSGDESYLLPSEAAEELGGVTAKTIGRWAKEGKLPYLRTLGGHRRYPATAIRELAATLSHEPEPDDDGGPQHDRRHLPDHERPFRGQRHAAVPIIP